MAVPKNVNVVDLRDPDEAAYWVSRFHPWSRYQIEIAISFTASRNFQTIKQCLEDVFPMSIVEVLSAKKIEPAKKVKDKGYGFGD